MVLEEASVATGGDGDCLSVIFYVSGEENLSAVFWPCRACGVLWSFFRLILERI